MLCQVLRRLCILYDIDIEYVDEPLVVQVGNRVLMAEGTTSRGILDDCAWIIKVTDLDAWDTTTFTSIHEIAHVMLEEHHMRQSEVVCDLVAYGIMRHFNTDISPMHVEEVCEYNASVLRDCVDDAVMLINMIGGE